MTAKRILTSHAGSLPRPHRFRNHQLAPDQALLVGVVDTQTNYVEHPELIADRLVQAAKLLAILRASWLAPIVASIPLPAWVA